MTTEMMLGSMTRDDIKRAFEENSWAQAEHERAQKKVWPGPDQPKPTAADWRFLDGSWYRRTPNPSFAPYDPTKAMG